MQILYKSGEKANKEFASFRCLLACRLFVALSDAALHRGPLLRVSALLNGTSVLVMNVGGGAGAGCHFRLE